MLWANNSMFTLIQLLLLPYGRHKVNERIITCNERMQLYDSTMSVNVRIIRVLRIIPNGP